MEGSQKDDRATDDHMDNMVVMGNSKQRDGESRPLGGGTTIKEMSIMKYCAINTIRKDISFVKICLISRVTDRKFQSRVKSHLCVNYGLPRKQCKKHSVF